ncbi:MAG: DUF2190 family protein [Chroococcidiopsis sp.]
MPLARDTGVPTHSLQNLSMTYASPTSALVGQLVGWDGLLSTGATPVKGVLLDDAVQNQTVSIGMAGLHECLSGAAVAVGALIGSDGTGRGITVGAGVQSIGRAMTATTAANQKFQLYITREGTN